MNWTGGRSPPTDDQSERLRYTTLLTLPGRYDRVGNSACGTFVNSGLHMHILVLEYLIFFFYFVCLHTSSFLVQLPEATDNSRH